MRVWGAKLFSVRAVAVSLAVSMGIMLIDTSRGDIAWIELVFSPHRWTTLCDRYSWYSYRELSYGAVLLLATAGQAIAPVGARWRTPAFAAFSIGVVAVSVVDLRHHLFGDEVYTDYYKALLVDAWNRIHEVDLSDVMVMPGVTEDLELRTLAGAVAISTGLDVIVVALTRTLMRKVSAARSVGPALTMVLAYGALSALFVYIFVVLTAHDLTLVLNLLRKPTIGWSLLPVAFSMSQADAWICGVFFVVGLVTLLNHLLWRALRRFTFGLHDNKIFEQRGWFFKAGVACLAVAAFGWIWSVVVTAFKG